MMRDASDTNDPSTREDAFKEGFHTQHYIPVFIRKIDQITTHFYEKQFTLHFIYQQSLKAEHDALTNNLRKQTTNSDTINSLKAKLFWNIPRN